MLDPKELAYAKKVQSLLDEEIARLTASNKELKRSVRERTRELMESDPFGALYAGTDEDQLYSASSELRSENERDVAAAREMLRKAETYKRMKKTPYFGRVDFTYAGEDAPESFYIGLSTLNDGDDFDVAVYDWRAPVSSLFYTGETGPAFYEAPAGRFDGEIGLIRQYAFENGELKDHRDADLRIDDELLRQTLSGASAERMKPIVATIQREQNRAIRFDLRRNLVVTGPAGCGKTSIGTHRLAWLLYQQKTGGQTPRLLMFTANEAFREYISNVLPELGENAADTAKYADLFRAAFRKYRVSDALSQTEALLKGDAERTEAVRKLYSERFTAYIDDALDHCAARFADVAFFDIPLVTAEDLRARFAALPVSAPLLARLDAVYRWAADEAKNNYMINKEILDRCAEDADQDGDTPTESAQKLTAAILREVKTCVFGAADTDPAALLARLAREHFGDDAFTAGLAERLEMKQLRYEDAAALLYVAAKLGAAELRRAPTHILIDEAQDLAPIQHKTLRLLFPKAVFTLLADPRQGVVPDADTASAARIAEIYGADRIAIGKTYRATRQLGEYSKKFLSPADADYEVFEREGEPPFIYKTKDPAAETAGIVGTEPERLRSVCVILKTAEEAKEFYEKLSALLPDCGAALSEEDRIRSRVVVMPLALTKGLEFDSVILPQAESWENDPSAGYLATTRALHRLHLLYKF